MSARAISPRAKAGVSLARAQVDQDKTMLSKATIYAPIDGVVLDRKVSAGQTVVAAMSTPVLFTLASDLNQMELDVDIDEADVGQISPGAKASFSVDAYPARKFAAKLISVHSAPKTVQGVVTYQGVLLVQNRGRAAEAWHDRNRRDRSGECEERALGSERGAAFRADRRREERRAVRASGAHGINAGRVWVMEGSKLMPHDIRLGSSDGHSSQILTGDLKPGENVVTDFVKAPGQP